MKDLIKTSAVFTLLVIIIPMLSFLSPNRISAQNDDAYVNIVKGQTVYTGAEDDAVTTLYNTDDIISDIINDDNISDADTKEIYDGSEEFKVLDFTSGQVYTVTMLDYVTGAVLAEMPATFHDEALKAQAVAAHTYAVRQMEKQIISPDAELLGAYISNDSSKFQAFFTTEQAKSFYGDAYDEYYNKVHSAVSDVISKVLFYDDEPIVAAFHSTSGGKTESAEVIWGSEIEYLIPVDSSFDESSPSYLEEKTFTSDEVSSRLSNAYPNITLEKKPSKWLSVLDRSSSSTVTSIKAGDIEIHGTEFRSVFSLRSANFTIDYDTDKKLFTITTKGYGHGVGLSQYGANALANDGLTYEEILYHYYSGVEIKDCNNIF